MRTPPSDPWDYNTYYDSYDGNRYHWDPDFQCWYRVLTKEQYDKLSHWQKHQWIYWCLLSLALSIYFVL